MTKAVAKSRYLLWRRSLSTLGMLGTSIFFLSTVPAIAQTATGSSDVDSTFGDNDGLNMFELMHRAQQGQIRNPYEFSEDQGELINNEAADFRTRQQEALQQQQPQEAEQPTQTNPDATMIQPEGNSL